MNNTLKKKPIQEKPRLLHLSAPKNQQQQTHTSNQSSKGAAFDFPATTNTISPFTPFSL